MSVEVREALDKAGKILIVSHQDPDGDALGSTLGLMHLLEARGKKVWVYSAGPLPPEYSFLPGMDRLGPLPGADDVDAAVLLDCHQPERTGPESGAWLSGFPWSLVVDHHRGEVEYGQTAWVDSSFAATSEMLAQTALEGGWEINPPAATCLFTGLQTDTGSFRYSNTRPRSLRLAADLVEAGADPWAVSQEVYATFPKRILLLGRIMEGLVLEEEGRLALARVTLDDLRATGSGPQDLEQVVETLRTIPGVEVSILVREMEGGRAKGSLRSRGRVDVSGVAMDLGGGGHRNAAGFKLEGGVAEVQKRVADMVRPLLGKGTGAGA